MTADYIHVLCFIVSKYVTDITYSFGLWVWGNQQMTESYTGHSVCCSLVSHTEYMYSMRQ